MPVVSFLERAHNVEQLETHFLQTCDCTTSHMQPLHLSIMTDAGLQSCQHGSAAPCQRLLPTAQS